MKNAHGLTSKKQPQRQLSLVEKLQDYWFDVTDKLRENKNNQVIKSVIAFALMVMLAVMAVAGAKYLQDGNTDPRSQASLNKVDVRVAAAESSFKPNTEFSVPIYLQSNGRAVTGLELKIELSNPAAAEIIEVVTNADWAVTAVSDVQSHSARLVFVSDCNDTGCATASNASLIATLRIRAAAIRNTSTTEIKLDGTKAAVLGEKDNMIGDLYGATYTIASANPNEEASPTPSVRPQPAVSPTPPAITPRPSITPQPTLTPRPTEKPTTQEIPEKPVETVEEKDS